jgi:hypothetical protein
MYFPRVVVAMFSRRGKPGEPAGKKKNEIDSCHFGHPFPNPRDFSDLSDFSDFHIFRFSTYQPYTGYHSRVTQVPLLPSPCESRMKPWCHGLEFIGVSRSFLSKQSVKTSKISGFTWAFHKFRKQNLQ